MKAVIVVALVAVVFALAMAGRAMLRDGRDGAPKSHRMVNALTWRIALSVGLFLFLLLSWQLGWIEPGGITAGR